MNTNIKYKDKQKPDKDYLKAVVFAYFANNKFLGWYADTFGSVREWPKIYRNSDRQIEIIETNFNRKLNTIARTNFEVANEKAVGLAKISLAIFDSEDKLRGKEVELRIVELPFYDNPDEHYRWISINQEQIRSWALNRPKKFIKIIKHKKEK